MFAESGGRHRSAEQPQIARPHNERARAECAFGGLVHGRAAAEPSARDSSCCTQAVTGPVAGEGAQACGAAGACGSDGGGGGGGGGSGGGAPPSHSSASSSSLNARWLIWAAQSARRRPESRCARGPPRSPRQAPLPERTARAGPARASPTRGRPPPAPPTACRGDGSQTRPPRHPAIRWWFSTQWCARRRSRAPPPNPAPRQRRAGRAAGVW